MATSASDPVPSSLDERTRISIEFGGVLELFETQVANVPNSVAIRSKTTSLSYAELNRRAGRLAHSLKTLGIGSDDVVAVISRREPSFVVAALAVLKVGAAYLPLDASLPFEHVAGILDDARVSAVVTNKSFQSAGFCANRSVVLLDADDSESVAEIKTTPVAATLAANDLAYVIYTSGSTGKPKGVEIEHRSLLHLIRWHQKAFGITAADTAAQFSSLSFDAAVWEIWPYLASGATVQFVPDSIRVQPEPLRDWIVENRITICFVPTAIAESLIELPWPTTTALRTLLTGADTLHRFPKPGLPFQLVNNYGPTECTVVATSGVVSPDADASTFLPTIGHPIAKTRVHLLSKDLKPVAHGESGEIFIAGPSLARGYRNRPDLTAECFVTSADSRFANERLYRTGDLGLLLPSGEIAFLGRVDDQIKIAGHRIEPNQIVRILENHSGIDTAAVIARDDAGSSKKLVAYVVPKRGFELKRSELRDFLAQRLPAFMVPAIFIDIESMPLTPNGKIDRSALPAPNSSNILQDRALSQPSSPVEERLARILGKLLGMDSVDVDDNFFNLGGHSLLATQLIARIRDAFGVDLSLRTIFDTPTIAQLAPQIEESVLKKISAMSEEDARELLNSIMPPGTESASL